MAAVVAGVALRVWLLVLPTGSFDSDEAVPGLIARHALYQRELSAFYWGQAYGGTLEPLLSVPAFAVFGPSIGAIKAVPLVLSAVSAVLVWRLGRRTVGERAGVLGAAAFFVWPANYLWLSTKERGFYWVCMVVGLALLLCTLRICDDPRRKRHWVLLGLLGGLGVWTSPQILFFAVPALVYLLARVGRDGWRLVLAVPGGVIGALPWLAFNLRNGFASFHRPPFTYDLGYLGNTRVLFTRGLPVVLGLHAGERWLDPAWLMKALFAVFALLAAAGLVRRPRPSHVWLLVLFCATYALLWGIYPVSGIVGEGRYLMFLLPAVVLLVASAARGAAAGTVLLAAMVGLSVLGVLRIADATAPPAPDVAMPHHAGPLVEFLERQGMDRVYANYWIAYRLAFESGERIIATPADASARYQPYVDALRQADAPAYAFPAKSQQVAQFEAGLAQLGVPYQRWQVGEFVVLRPERRVEWAEVLAAGAG
ncbi:MAG: glycosyltransferase family 39 protein [Actinobacteria bacterium]|nr:glycosyltransferase family 39 protein [Actinomycetota bacterium]MBW3650807.1 glycosyltransferase family 39 protein [Actinomycetota bacterium]